MKILSFEKWCRKAVQGVRFKADRPRIEEELYGHMEELYEEYLSAGEKEQAAEDAVLAEMGDAAETARQLQAVHRPFWGYALKAVRAVLIAALVLALLYLPRFISRTKRYVSAVSPEFNHFLIDSEDRLATGGVTGERVFFAEPMSKASSDGYTFILTRAAEWLFTAEDGSTDCSFYLMVEVSNPLPWAEESDILREFYAVDSLGQVYKAFNRTDYRDPEDQVLAGNPYSSSGLGTVRWSLWLTNYCSQEADWIELRYDLAGRDLRLRVDLKGGGVK
ncbi:MAG: hypothetical protein IKI82_05765 [Lachnospiraceae bacterium]|nr:hypothetical protein [Lachnospiraceae bacterium]